jgi:hypothetical protein
VHVIYFWLQYVTQYSITYTVHIIRDNKLLLRGKHSFLSLSFSLLFFSMPLATVTIFLICDIVTSEIAPRKHSMLEKYVKRPQQTMHDTSSHVRFFFPNSVSTFILPVYYKLIPLQCKFCVTLLFSVNCLVMIKLFPISDNSCYCQYNLWWQ